MLPTLSQVLTVARASRDSFNGWKRRGLLIGEDIPETKQGVATRMTHAPALQVAYMAALTRVGFDASEAAERATVYANHARAGILKDWLLFDPATGLENYCGSDGAASPLSSLMDIFADDEGRQVTEGEGCGPEDFGASSATELRAVHLAAIAHRIDELFSVKAA